MKEFKTNDIEVSGDDFESKSLKSKNIGKLYGILFKQIYRKPIQSIIREITSNCFDSHIEAKVDDAVVIKIKEDEGGWYISFNDFGVGLSPQRINDIYLAPGESTKTDSNEQIGQFGLGSKSPFSYTNNFFINTIYNKIKYEYLFYEDAKGEFHLDKILEEEINQRNGTEVKIYMKQDSDAHLFVDACQSELIYFDNVYYDIQSHYSYSTIDNDYTIFDRKTFKYCPDKKYSDELHLILGKVAYPIDWKALGVERINLPLGLKFNIGEIPVTPERESVRYIEFTDSEGNQTSTISIIKKRIDEFKDEILGLFTEQVKDQIETDDLIDYYHKPYLDPILKFISKRTGDTYTINVRNIKSITDIKRVYTPLVDYKLTMPSNPFTEYVYVGEVNNKGTTEIYANLKRKFSSLALTINEYENNLVCLYPSSGKFDKKKNLYLKEYAKDLGIYGKIIFIKEYKNKELSYIKSLFGIGSLNKALKAGFYPSQQVRLYRKHIKEVLYERVISYENFQIPQKWLDKYKEDNKVKRTQIQDDEIIIYNLGFKDIELIRETLHIKTLENFTGFLIYGHDEDEFLLSNFKSILTNSKYADNKTNYSKSLNPVKCRLYKTAKKNAKVLNQFSNCIHVTDFMNDNKVFKNIATAIIIEKKTKALKLENKVKESKIKELDVLMTIIFPPVAKAYKELERFCLDFGLPLKQQDAGLVPAFKEEMINLALEQGLYKKDLVDLSDRIDKYFKGLELLSYLDINEESLPHIIKFFKLSEKKVDDLWDNIDYYIEIMKHYKSKVDYMLEILSYDVTSSPSWNRMTRNNQIVVRSKIDRNKNQCEQYQKDLQTLNKYHEIITEN